MICRVGTSIHVAQLGGFRGVVNHREPVSHEGLESSRLVSDVLQDQGGVGPEYCFVNWDAEFPS